MHGNEIIFRYRCSTKSRVLELCHWKSCCQSSICARPAIPFYLKRKEKCFYRSLLLIWQNWVTLLSHRRLRQRAIPVITGFTMVNDWKKSE